MTIETCIAVTRMLPSRGLRWSGHAINTGKRRLDQWVVRSRGVCSSKWSQSPRAQLTSGQFASVIPRTQLPSPSPPKLHQTPLLAARSPWRSQGLRNSSPLVVTAAIRFASSTPTASQTSVPETVAIPTDTFSATSFNDLSQLTSADLAAIPERIGYLKDLGLDYGWGPTAFIQFLLEHIHIYTGTPWWASILLTAVTVRLALFKPYVGAADASARLAKIQPITAPVRDKMMACQRTGDQQGMLLARQELKEIHKKADIKTYKAFVPLLQVFLGFGTFRLFRGMASLPVPGLETGGLLWLQDLTVPDPYYILPVVTSAAFYLLMRVRF